MKKIIILIIISAIIFFIFLKINKSDTGLNNIQYTMITACENREHGAKSSDRFMTTCESDQYCELVKVNICPECNDEVTVCVAVEIDTQTRLSCLAANGEWSTEKKCSLP